MYVGDSAASVRSSDCRWASTLSQTVRSGINFSLEDRLAREDPQQHFTQSRQGVSPAIRQMTIWITRMPSQAQRLSVALFFCVSDVRHPKVSAAGGRPEVRSVSFRAAPRPPARPAIFQRALPAPRSPTTRAPRRGPTRSRGGAAAVRRPAPGPGHSAGSGWTGGRVR